MSPRRRPKWPTAIAGAKAALIRNAAWAHRMHDETPTPGSVSTHDRAPLLHKCVAPQGVVVVDRMSYYWRDLREYGWPLIFSGISQAGGIYPILLGTIFLVILSIGGVSALLHGARVEWEMILGLVVGVPMSAMISGIAGLIWAGIVALICEVVIHLFLRSMKLRPSFIWLGAVTGGLAGFVAVLPVAFQIASMIMAGDALGAFMVFFVGPGLTTILGQLGGARGGRMAAAKVAARNSVRQSLADVGWRPTTLRQHDDNDGIYSEGGRLHFRFRTIHLLWISLWASLLLMLIRISGVPFGWILPVLAGWFLYQAGTLWLGTLLIRRLGPWWAQRRSGRST